MSLNEVGDVLSEGQSVWYDQKVALLQEQGNQAREHIYRLSVDLHQAHRTIHGISRNLEKAQDNFNDLNDQLRKSQAEVKEHVAKIKELEETVAKQKITIKVQSDTISETRDLNALRRNGQDPRAAIYNQPPPIYNQLHLAYNQPQAVNNQPFQTHGEPYPIHTQPYPTYGQPQPPANYPHHSSNNPSPQKARSNNGQYSPLNPQFGHAPPGSAHTLSTPSRRAGTPSAYSPHASTPSSAYASGALEVFQPSNLTGLRPTSLNHASVSPEKWMGEISGYSAGSGVTEGQNTLTIQIGNEIDEVPWPAEFGHFFKLTEEWALNYANVPNENQDKRLPEELLASMQRQVSDDMVWKFLGWDACRYFLVARLINTWITNDIFRGQCFLHYSPDFDQKFHRSQVTPPNNALYTRGVSLVAAADAAKEMQGSPQFSQFVTALITKKAEGIWARLTPLLAPETLRPQAHDDMVHLIGEAIRVGLLIISTPLAYSIEFPQASAGQQVTFFRPDAMINRNPPELQIVHSHGRGHGNNEDNGDPQRTVQLLLHQAHEAAAAAPAVVVRLGITPVIVVTSFAGPGLNPRTVHFANVLVSSGA